MVQLLPQYHRILILAGTVYSSVLSEFRGDPKCVWFFDRQGSGGFNRLITRLNEFPPSTIQRLIVASPTRVDNRFLDLFLTPIIKPSERYHEQAQKTETDNLYHR
jgi:hypothetical protein